MSGSLAGLSILGSGAVTPVGMNAAQSCAAIRAGIKRFTPIEAQLLDEDEPQIGARVSADPRLRETPEAWLFNLAARALRECEAGCDPATSALFLLVPEPHRKHPLSEAKDEAILARLAELIGHAHGPGSRVVRDGAAATIRALGDARALIAEGRVTSCIIGGADSLIRPAEVERLEQAGRLLRPERSQGLLPGEGAAFVRVGQSDEGVRVRGLGVGYERNTVLGGEYSVGDAFVGAFEAALQDADLPEAKVDFVAGNLSGERYDAWELSHTHARCYRTRREQLPVMWPSTSTGDLGVAGGPLALIAAATAIDRGYGAGPVATVQLRSEGELRGVAVLSSRDL